LKYEVISVHIPHVNVGSSQDAFPERAVLR